MDGPTYALCTQILSLRNRFSHSSVVNGMMSASVSKGQFQWQLGDNCANARDEQPCPDVATRCADVQTAVDRQHVLSPLNV